MMVNALSNQVRTGTGDPRSLVASSSAVRTATISLVCNEPCRISDCFAIVDVAAFAVYICVPCHVCKQACT
jgi:hypothetical protein